MFQPIKNLTRISILLLPLYFLTTHSLITELLTPLPSPSLGPESIFNFLDTRLALVYSTIQTFKNTITSDPLGITETWTGPDICSYEGFFCDNPPDNLSATTVAAIDFNGFHLAAPTLDGFIDQLPDLALFHANSNNFSGTISPNISKLRYFFELDVSNNLLSGTFPTAVIGMNGLIFLDIRYNSFTGSVPPQIFLQTLALLFINNNNFILKLPDNLGSTTASYLTLANNKFTGPIPKSIGDASSTLIEVLFLNNLLTGCLPYEIGFLRNATVFDAGDNLLTGPLPCSLGCLEKIEQLNFAGNFLYGQVPEEICALGNLANLSLSDNYFTKVGPICRKMIRDGVLDVRKNCIHHLSLADQRSVHECFLFFLHPIHICPHPELFGVVPCKAHDPMHHWMNRTAGSSSSVTYTATHSRHRL